MAKDDTAKNGTAEIKTKCNKICKKSANKTE
jgi:hypothetical protein